MLDKLKDLLSKNADKVDTAIDKAGDVVDDKTQGKYKDTVDNGHAAFTPRVSGGEPSAATWTVHRGFDRSIGVVWFGPMRTARWRHHWASRSI